MQKKDFKYRKINVTIELNDTFMYHKRDTSCDRTGRRSTALRNAEGVGWKGING
mgnify:CR=1 FL=1